MICREASLDTVMAELAVYHLNLVLADHPIPPTVSSLQRSVPRVSVTRPVSFFRGGIYSQALSQHQTQ